MVEFFVRLLLVRRALRQHRANSLEESYIIPNPEGLLMRYGQCKGMRQIRYGTEETRFPVLLLENMLLCTGQDRQSFVRFARQPRRPVKATHHAARRIV